METRQQITGKNKGGRPTTDPKSHVLRIRVSDSMHDKVKAYSDRQGQTMTDTVRECIDGYLSGK